MDGGEHKKTQIGKIVRKQLITQLSIDLRILFSQCFRFLLLAIFNVMTLSGTAKKSTKRTCIVVDLYPSVVRLKREIGFFETEREKLLNKWVYSTNYLNSSMNFSCCLLLFGSIALCQTAPPNKSVWKTCNAIEFALCERCAVVYTETDASSILSAIFRDNKL